MMLELGKLWKTPTMHSRFYQDKNKLVRWINKKINTVRKKRNKNFNSGVSFGKPE